MPTSKPTNHDTTDKAVNQATIESKPDEALLKKLKDFIRTRGAGFLKNQNITSIGIGFKKTAGKSTKEIAIQFTVKDKASKPQLEALGVELIPTEIIVDGQAIPTDVLQRTYRPSYRLVPEIASNNRKTRANPIMPGISVGHYQVTAGTIGCVVYDQHSGLPYMLSNWHVLHGPTGKIGDDVVQPGPHDDNRIALNRVGQLVRSHLGQAGDCAIASIEAREFTPDILDLGVSIDALVEPEIGDKVVKSGRTTGVTHGQVSRIDVLVRLNYDLEQGEQAIGGFEIEPDANHPTDNGELSMGGDSGAVWLLKHPNGQISRMMAGLHFAGEGANDSHEHALACYAHSVFEKLEISLKAPVHLLEHVANDLQHGYDPNFLDQLVPEPELTEAGKKQAYYAATGSEIIRYTHFSVAMHAKRRLALWVAWNIDGSQMRRLDRAGFRLDPNVPASIQAGEELYANNPIDRGHLARRADLCWGGLAEAQQANRDSFYFTNIAPQMEDFNQSGLGGLWGKLEDEVFAVVKVQNLRVSVFAAPVFHEDDRLHRSSGIKIPREFYKILVYVEEGVLKVKAFLLTQSLAALEAFDLARFRVYEVTLPELERRCAYRFPNILKAADCNRALLKRSPELLAERHPLTSLREIVW